MEKEVRNEIQKGIDKGLDALADASGWDRESLRTYILCVSIHAPHAGGQRGWALCLRNFQRNLGGEGLFLAIHNGRRQCGWIAGSGNAKPLNAHKCP